MTANSENARRITRASGIHPGMIFVGRTTLPHDKDANQRPYLAIRKIHNQVIALPLTSLEKKVAENETYKEICIRHKRNELDYYAIAPNTNIYNDSISPPPNSNVHSYSKGWIDLITPMTLGTKNIVTAKRVDEISQTDLNKVIAAHEARIGFKIGGGSGGYLGVGARVSNSGMAQGFQKILNITKALLQASENKEATQGESERKYREMIGICNDFVITFPPSPPHEEISSLEIPGEIDLLPPRVSPKRRRRRATKSSGTCNEGQSEIRRTDDPNGGGGPSGGGPSESGPNGAGDVTSLPTENKPQAGKGTGGENKTSAQNESSAHCASQNLAGEWTDEDWQLIEYEDEDEDDGGTSTEEILREPWQLLEYESSYCDSESDSYVSSSELDGPDVESWRESLPDPVQTSNSAADATVKEQSRMLKAFIIMRYLDTLRTDRRSQEGMLDPRIQDSLDKSLLTSSEIPKVGRIISPSEKNVSSKPLASTESSSLHDKSLSPDTTLKKARRIPAITNVTCPKCKQAAHITTGARGSKSPTRAFCEKCNNSVGISLLRTPLPLLRQHQDFDGQEDENLDMQKNQIVRIFGEGFDILKNSSRAVFAGARYSGLANRFWTQANGMERNSFAIGSCAEPWSFMLRELEEDKIGSRETVDDCQSVLEGKHDEGILCFLDEVGYVDLGKDEYRVNCTTLRDSVRDELSSSLPSIMGVTNQTGQISSNNIAGQQPEAGETCTTRTCKLFDRSRSNALKTFQSGQSNYNQTQVQRLASPALQYATAIQRRCDYLLRLINPAHKSLPVHTIFKKFLEYVYSVKKISRTGSWEDAGRLETLPCVIFPKEYLPVDSDVLINLLRSYPLTDGDPDIQALARLSLTNDSDLLLERINFALPRSGNDWLATDNVCGKETIRSTSDKRLLLQQDGMIKWIRFLLSTLGLGEALTKAFMEEEGSSKIEKDLLYLLDNLGKSDSENKVEEKEQGRIPFNEKLEGTILEERDKKLKCENERCRRCMFVEQERCFSGSFCINTCNNSEDCNCGEEP